MSSSSGATSAQPDLGAPPQLLTVLTTEHFALQGTRGVATAEAMSRCSLYVATLSSGLVAIGFASNHAFLGYFLAGVLPLVATVGVVTFVRLVALSVDDLRLMRDIERIHSYYSALSPTAALYFPHVDTTDLNALLTFSGRRASALQIFSSAAAMVALLNSAVVGAGVTLVISAATDGLSAWSVGVGSVGVLAYAVVAFRFLYISTSTALRHRADFESLRPSTLGTARRSG
jgi:hypothetical protein